MLQRAGIPIGSAELPGRAHSVVRRPNWLAACCAEAMVDM